MKEIQLPESADSSDEYGCSIIRGFTGRTINFLTSEHEAENRMVLEWQEESLDMTSLLAHSAAATFQDLIKTAEVLGEPILVAYRGRPISHRFPYPVSHEFGPPSAEKAQAGRYNLEGIPALYLSTSRQGVAAELKNRPKAIEEILYCQDYAIPTAMLRIANFASPSVNNFVQIAFDYAEHASNTGATDKHNYLFSQTLAQIVVKTGFTAMLVPGVRGSQDNRYNNLVVFSPGERWKSWYCNDSPPVII